MSGYVPANTYDPAPPEYDNNGYPLQQRFQQQYPVSGAPYSPPAWNATGYGYSGGADQEALLKDQKLYQGTPPLGAQTPTTPPTPFPTIPGTEGRPAQPEHRGSTLYRAPVNHTLRHRFRQIKQFRRLLTRVVSRLLISCLFSAAIVLLLKYYESLGVLNKKQKYMFNALYLGASLLLALNIVVCFLLLGRRDGCADER